ncbi:MAG TPA: hypothetical protein PKK10_07130 [Woeseiaceae bacterium]|nr:hypothetical protein [Woeseiaceae bacterium]
MRNLSQADIEYVSGGAGGCTAGNWNPEKGNTPGQLSVPNIGAGQVCAYETLVDLTSLLIERVANALD